jgi:uncharacterized protein YbjT (DUF2867 family)
MDPCEVQRDSVSVVLRLPGKGVRQRHPARARSALREADLDRVTILRADVCDQASVAAAIGSAEGVVNVVSAYVERGGASFEAIHERGARTVARQAAAAGLTRLVLVSGIGADPESRLPYIRVRRRGELVVQHTFPAATVVRPGPYSAQATPCSVRSPASPAGSRWCH